MKIIKRNATGVLARMIAETDPKSLAKTRKRMMLAAKIEDAMKECGYSKKQFAAVMGKSPTVITEWLSGGRNFTVDTLTDIEEALHVQLLDVTVPAAVAV